MTRISFSLACVAISVVAAGCTVHQTEAPGFTGPSEFALSVSMSADPDTLFSDGRQTATIQLSARDASGAPQANKTFALSTKIDDSIVSFGTLSTPTIRTGADGRATATYTMPAFTVFDAGTPPRQVSVVATAVGTDYITARSQAVLLQLVPPAVPTAAPGSPTAALKATPETAKVNQLVTFDASLSMAEAGHTIDYYYWNFGDGLIHEEHGSDASHVYVTAGTYVVVLGIRDDMGRTANTFKQIVVN
jgi:PKD repeat protein